MVSVVAGRTSSILLAWVRSTRVGDGRGAARRPATSQQRRCRRRPSASSAAADRRSRARAYIPWLSSTRPTEPVASSPNVAAIRALRRSLAAHDGDHVAVGPGPPQGGSSSGPTLSWQLPKRSTHSTSAWIPSASVRGRAMTPGTSRSASSGCRARRGRRRCTGGQPPGRTRHGRRTSLRELPVVGGVVELDRSCALRRRGRRQGRAARCPARRAPRRRRRLRRRSPCGSCRRRDRRRRGRRPRRRRGSPGPTPATRRERRRAGSRG